MQSLLLGIHFCVQTSLKLYIHMEILGIPEPKFLNSCRTEFLHSGKNSGVIADNTDTSAYIPNFTILILFLQFRKTEHYTDTKDFLEKNLINVLRPLLLYSVRQKFCLVSNLEIKIIGPETGLE